MGVSTAGKYEGFLPVTSSMRVIWVTTVKILLPVIPDIAEYHQRQSFYPNSKLLADSHHQFSWKVGRSFTPCTHWNASNMTASKTNHDDSSWHQRAYWTVVSADGAWQYDYQVSSPMEQLILHLTVSRTLSGMHKDAYLRRKCRVTFMITNFVVEWLAFVLWIRNSY